MGLTAFEAAVALAKCCVGSGVLALPSAVQRGGLVFSPLALIGMASWNYVAVDMMVVCKQIVASRKLPPGVNSALASYSVSSSQMSLLAADATARPARSATIRSARMAPMGCPALDAGRGTGRCCRGKPLEIEVTQPFLPELERLRQGAGNLCQSCRSRSCY